MPAEHTHPCEKKNQYFPIGKQERQKRGACAEKEPQEQ